MVCYFLEMVLRGLRAPQLLADFRRAGTETPIGVNLVVYCCLILMSSVP